MRLWLNSNFENYDIDFKNIFEKLYWCINFLQASRDGCAEKQKRPLLLIELASTYETSGVTAGRSGVTAIQSGVTAVQSGVTACRSGVTAIQSGVTATQSGVTACRSGVSGRECYVFIQVA